MGTDYQQRPSHHISPFYVAAAAVVVSLAFTALLVTVLRYCARSLKEAQEADAADRRRAPPQSAAGGDADDGRGVALAPRQQPPAPAAVAVEMVWSMGPLVCTYRRADGWAEAACAVCLAELDDGVGVRVLPVCMHYFHADCVGEWLRAHDTCPLCRAPLDPPAAAAG
ncbi:hypothetical protein BS78_K334500 [Paspalum vaginatum]|uniref:RING-type E3 ubiquitin transferase n=1 Tax=Paspalum vaginatum TaxID=158149 RepID=A0A9W8CF97_9POAL|nr:hypothetical protein BS78_K334500 [Paspalum vaginatum]